MSQTATDNNAEIRKFENKVEVGLQQYTYHNEKAKEDIIAAKKAHDEIMDSLLVTTIVCQAELYANAAAQLQQIVELLPPQKVEQVRARVHDIIKKGGIQPPAPAPQGSLQKGLAIVTGKALPSEFKSSNSAAPAQATAARPPAPPANGGFEKDPFADSGNPFALDSPAAPAPRAVDENPFAPSAPPAETASVPPPPPPAAPAATGGAGAQPMFVEALFDHEAEEEDELNFFAGDTVEVLEMADGGWWRGRCRGKEGLFPVNYVRTEGAS